MHRTILVAATPDDAGRDALALAVELARPTGARVVLGGVTQHQGDGAQLAEQLEALRQTLPHDVSPSAEVVEGRSLVRGLHELVTEHDAQLVVLGPTHRGIFERALRGDLASDVVFTASCGVAVAMPHQVPGAPRRIGVAWDATPEANEALEWAIQLAERTGATVRIMRVLDPRHAEGTKPAIGAREELVEVCRAAERRASSESHIAWGDPAPVLSQLSHDVDLLVLGSRAHSSMRRLFFGSVSADVLHHAHSAVVILPHGVVVPQDTVAV